MYNKDIRTVAIKTFDDLAKRHEGYMTEFTLDWHKVVQKDEHGQTYEYWLPMLDAKWQWV